MSNTLHIACSPLSANIYCGGVQKDGMTWRSNKTEVTGQACAAVAQHVLASGGTTEVTENGKLKYTITVQEHGAGGRA